jgi:hypothetical protein
MVKLSEEHKSKVVAVRIRGDVHEKMMSRRLNPDESQSEVLRRIIDESLSRDDEKT